MYNFENFKCLMYSIDISHLILEHCMCHTLIAMTQSIVVIIELIHTYNNKQNIK